MDKKLVAAELVKLAKDLTAATDTRDWTEQYNQELSDVKETLKEINELVEKHKQEFKKIDKTNTRDSAFKMREISNELAKIRNRLKK